MKPFQMKVEISPDPTKTSHVVVVLGNFSLWQRIKIAYYAVFQSEFVLSGKGWRYVK